MRGAAVGVATLAVVFLATGMSPPRTTAVPAAELSPAQAAAAAPAVADVCGTPQGAADAAGLDTDQQANARVIIAAAHNAGAGPRGAEIGIATALVEGAYTRGEREGKVPGLRNVPYGDRDSLGLFQQRPSQGWGTPAQVMDPAYAAGKFFEHLTALPGWRGMDPGAAAQRVQRSAYPARYGQRMGQARSIVAALDQAARMDCTPTKPAAAPPQDCPATGSPAERGLQPNTLRGLRCGVKAWPDIKHLGGKGGRPNASDHPNGAAVDFMIPKWRTETGRAYGWDVANWFRGNAEELNVKNVIWDARIWSPRRKDWEKYTHPNGPTTNPRLLHLDHVHVSFVE